MRLLQFPLQPLQLTPWRQRHFDESAAPWHRRIDLGGDCRRVITHQRPDIRPEHDQREFPPRQVLLIPDVLIGCHQNVKPCRFGRKEKRSVFKLRVPLHFVEGANRMVREEGSNAHRDVFVKDDAQRGG